MAERDFDFIICGGGSAASVAAMRLVRDFGFSVLMLERGPRSTNPIMAMPAGYMKYLGRDTYLEMHHTVPQPQLGGRGPIVPVATALGGGSAVNAMVYMRGQQQDYDGWAAGLGNGAGWSYADLLPHFTGLEANSRFNDQFHGIAGNLRVSEPGNISDTTEDFLRAVQGLGHAYNPDFNGARQSGVGIMQHTYGKWGRFKRRSDAKRAFLDPLGGDRRLTIVTDARVDRIVIESGRAVGVAYTVRGDPHEARAGREVLVGAGTYNTAKLLMLSGIGPADHPALLRANRLPGSRCGEGQADLGRHLHLVSAPPQGAWHGAPPLGRSGGPAAGQLQLLWRSRRPASHPQVDAFCPPDPRNRTVFVKNPRGNSPRRRHRRRCRARGLRRPDGQDQLPPRRLGAYGPR